MWSCYKKKREISSRIYPYVEDESMPEINSLNINQNFDIVFENNLKDMKKIIYKMWKKTIIKIRKMQIR